ncbi:YdcF family protein [Nocardia carnea]|uniref:YdcF family protein n=1 Tax=Nocardia carnea TaxID=37328 RepID=UPI00245892F0|nr:YdcF family protein [Nocardia carnea]
MKASAVTVAIGAVIVLWGEYENWRASHELVGGAEGPSEVVVVLGFRNRAASANALNRWRVRAGLRSLDSGAAGSRIAFSGGAVGGSVAEAELMASYARSVGYSGPLDVETESRSTWENVENAIPLIEEADRIKIVSNPLHAAKARRYLAQQRPDLALRLVRGAEYRFGEWMPLKPLFAAIGSVRR